MSDERPADDGTISAPLYPESESTGNVETIESDASSPVPERKTPDAPPLTNDAPEENDGDVELKPSHEGDGPA